MRYLGVSLFEGTNHTDGTGLLAALDAWETEAGRYPEYVPIWNNWSKPGRGPSGGQQFPDSSLIEGILQRGIEPMIYATTTTYAAGPSWNLQSYMDHDHDAVLEAWANEAKVNFPGQRFIVRVNQEPAADWCPWGADPDGPEGYNLNDHPHRFKVSFGDIGNVLRDINPDIEMYFCGNRTNTALSTYFPGDGRCDYVGFDSYSRNDPADDSVPKILQTSINKLRDLSDRKIIVGEFGRKYSMPDRWAWLGTLPDVDYGHLFMYFDMDLTNKGDQNWSMTPKMRQRYAGYIGNI